MIALAKTGLRRFATAPKQRNFMSSMTLSAPEDDAHFALILGKPGGGKGTISGKILKVRRPTTGRKRPSNYDNAPV